MSTWIVHDKRFTCINWQLTFVEQLAAEQEVDVDCLHEPFDIHVKFNTNLPKMLDLAAFGPKLQVGNHMQQQGLLNSPSKGYCMSSVCHGVH